MNDENISIDETTIINGEPLFAASDKSKITIGKYCAIANGLKIITLNHDYNYPAIQGTFYTNKLNCKHPGSPIATQPPQEQKAM